MEAARRAGPRSIRTQHRMVTTEDYANRVEDHPLVHRAHAWTDWSGSWTAMHVAVVAWDEHRLDDAPVYPTEMRLAIEEFHDEHRLPRPAWDGKPSLRQVLRLYLDAYRMAGQEVLLEDAIPVGIILGLSVIVDERYFRSEVRRAVEQALGRGPGGFFAPGRLRFGEDLHASDLFEALMDVEGVVDVTLDRFKRIGASHPDRAAEGRITLRGLEVAVCDNDPGRPERGYFRLNLCGGRRGGATSPAGTARACPASDTSTATPPPTWKSCGLLSCRASWRRLPIPRRPTRARTWTGGRRCGRARPKAPRRKPPSRRLSRSCNSGCSGKGLRDRVRSGSIRPTGASRRPRRASA
jgi:hypothetical protein